MHVRPALPRLVAGALLAGAFGAGAAAEAGRCSARSGGLPPRVVELYTSEGCSSCPPADRWLSSLRGRSDILALAFHVTYWDHLGWSDRFALREGTERQRLLARRDGAAAVYTPQVRADGRDWRGWPQLPPPAAGAPPAPVLQLRREGDTVIAEVAPLAAAGRAAWAGYWAVLEDGHESRVRAGENAGGTLRHDHVVRLYRPVAAWPAAQGGEWRLEVSRGVPQHPRRVAFVVVDEAGGQRPLQALALAC